MGEGRLMFAGRGERLFLFLLVPAILTDLGAAASLGQAGVKKPFTVADEIGLTHFYELGGGNGTVSFSPNGNYFAVWSERGRLALNRVEDDLRFYRTQDVKHFLEHPGDLQPPSPMWVVSRLGETGSVIEKWRWLPDSSGMVFLQHTDDTHRQLVLADARTKSTKSMTPATESVSAFEVQDRWHYTYSSAVVAPPEKSGDKDATAAIVGTGRSLQELLLTPRSNSRRVRVWRIAGDKRVEINQDAGSIQKQNPDEKAKTEHDGIELIVKQGLNDPPVLVAKDKQSSRILWDPNPYLRMLDTGQASVYMWKDKDGRERKGGLYKPSDYRQGKRYPLVIQTHDFNESSFSPAGSALTSSYAARALAVAGVVVLQVAEDCPSGTTDDGPCAVSAYESAVHQLVSEGIADPERIGIVAFSWPSFYVMELLTTSSVHVSAALIADGRFMGDYFQYMASVTGNDANPFAETTNAVIGAAPFGDGVQQWLKNSPSFHLERISAPLMMVAQGRLDVLLMWGPYAGLRYQHKPVDLVMIESSEHVLTNPRARMLSQGGTVDWFRFWLQGYEDPDPAKTEQYKRWRELKKMQDVSEKKPRADATTP